MNNSLVFRRAHIDDVPQLSALVQSSVREIFSRDYDASQTCSALEYVLRIDPFLIEDGTYDVCVCQGRIVASGGWSRRKNPYGDPFVEAAHGPRGAAPDLKPAVVRAMFVHPRFERRGIGRELLRRSEIAARQEGYNTLELFSTLTGVPLYLHCGFRCDRFERIELPNGVVLTGVRMSKRLLEWCYKPGVRTTNRHWTLR